MWYAAGQIAGDQAITSNIFLFRLWRCDASGPMIGIPVAALNTTVLVGYRDAFRSLLER